MNAKNRLQEIDQIVEDLYNDKIELREFVNESLEQAEQVDGLKNKAKKLKEEKQKFMLSATKQRKQKQLYREGLYRLTRNLEGRVDYILRDEINSFVEVLERESE